MLVLVKGAGTVSRAVCMSSLAAEQTFCRMSGVLGNNTFKISYTAVVVNVPLSADLIITFNVQQKENNTYG